MTAAPERDAPAAPAGWPAHHHHRDPETHFALLARLTSECSARYLALRTARLPLAGSDLPDLYRAACTALRRAMTDTRVSSGPGSR